MFGKEMSFEAVPENSQRWSWGDVGRQTGFQQPETQRSPAVESCVRRITSCEHDDDRRRRRWLKSAIRWM